VAWGDVGFNLKHFTGNEPGLVFIFVSKTITPQDYTDVAKTANLMQGRYGDRWIVIAKLNSTGGNVSAALKIGRFLRKKGAMANVDENAVCLSSCVYVLAGATYRAVDGIVGIHRPYEPNDGEISEDAQKTKYAKLGKEIISYLQAMNIPTRLYEDSLFISPDRIKILSYNETQGYGLNENDPYADEASAVNQAKKLGISRKEYAARELRSRRDCGLTTISNGTPKEEVLSAMECRTDILEGRR